MERNNKEIHRHVLINEIMVRMSLKTLLECLCVCKDWASIIRGKEFQDCYWRRSMTRPRLLFAFCQDFYDQPISMLVHSVHQEKEPLLSSGQQHMRISSRPEYAMISAPIRGLVCLRSDNKFVLCNPGTKKFRTLPECEASFLGHSVFGYDEVTDVFKVLISKTVDPRGVTQMAHQVFTVHLAELIHPRRPFQESWRPIVCQHHYIRVTNALCIGGVFYYVAQTVAEDSRSIVMSFNLRSEEFTVIELPKGVQIHLNGAKLVNYNGEVCLVIHGSDKDLDGSKEFLIHVRDENAGNWREERVVIPRWRDTAGSMSFSLEGTIETGELVFSANSVLHGSYFVLYYDTVTQNLRKSKIEGVDGGSYRNIKTYLNHYDSLLLT